MDLPLKPTQVAILPECINKAVSINGSGIQANHHIVELLGVECRHNSLRQQFSTAKVFCTEKLEYLLPSGFIK